MRQPTLKGVDVTPRSEGGERAIGRREGMGGGAGGAAAGGGGAAEVGGEGLEGRERRGARRRAVGLGQAQWTGDRTSDVTHPPTLGLLRGRIVRSILALALGEGSFLPFIPVLTFSHVANSLAVSLPAARWLGEGEGHHQRGIGRSSANGGWAGSGTLTDRVVGVAPQRDFCGSRR